MVVSAAIAAAFALPGCAPAGVNAADYGNGAEPAAENVAATSDPTAEPDPSDTSDPIADVDPDSTAPAGSDEDPGLGEEEATTSLTAGKVKRMGSVVTNDEGFVLYRFDADKNKPAESTCEDDCEKVWPPALTADGKPKLKGVDAKLVGTVTRPDGSKQLTLKGWPLYTYVGDKKPGQWKGQNVNAKWFVIQPDGAKNLTCLPAVSKPVAPPADDAGDEGGEGDEGNDAGGSDAGGEYSY